MSSRTSALGEDGVSGLQMCSRVITVIAEHPFRRPVACDSVSRTAQFMINSKVISWVFVQRNLEHGAWNWDEPRGFEYPVQFLLPTNLRQERR